MTAGSMTGPCRVGIVMIDDYGNESGAIAALKVAKRIRIEKAPYDKVPALFVKAEAIDRTRSRRRPR